MAELVELGYIGLFLAAFLAGTIIPFSSEVVITALLLAGYDTMTCLVVATIGNIIGGTCTYYMGYLQKWEWTEKYFRVKKEKIMNVRSRFKKWGPLSASLSFIPGLGNAILLALGFFHISPKLSFLFMCIGKIARYLIWIYLSNLTFGK